MEVIHAEKRSGLNINGQEIIIGGSINALSILEFVWSYNVLLDKMIGSCKVKCIVSYSVFCNYLACFSIIGYLKSKTITFIQRK